MDKLETYRQHIRSILDEYSSIKPAYGQVEFEQVIDPQRDHYQLLSIGWNGNQRIHGCVFHIALKDQKIWIEHDGTEEGIANRLVEMGVPKNEIVLAFQPPFRRQFGEFARE
jgi:hypothetical protein